MSSSEAAARAVPSGHALRVMAVVRWLLFASVGAVAAATWWRLVLHAPSGEAEEARFYCPMHPQITSAEPGSCPVCTMQLEPIPHAGRHADEPTTAERGEAHGGHAHTHGSEAAPPGDLVVGEAAEGTAPVMLSTERRQASGVALTTARREEVGGVMRWPATVEPIEGARAEVRVRAAAFVERVLARDTGTTVRRGQVLAWVVSPEIARAEEELLTAARWASRDPGGAAALEAARRRLGLLGVSVDEVDAVLEAGQPRARIALRAPITGTVTRLSAVLGATTGPDDALYEITSFARVRVVATVLSERELSTVGPASRARLCGARVEQDVPLALELIEPSVDPVTRGARVRFLADNPDGALRVGDLGEVVLEAPRASVVVVPRDAVLDRGHAHYVFVEVEPGVFEARTVRPGAIRGESREVLGGLHEGERVVSRGAFVLDSESRLAASLAPRPTGTGSGATLGEETAP
jgi:Cu(I)/Ag(I) efflux system membrane fusion protein